jgi:hypothetical protein
LAQSDLDPSVWAQLPQAVARGEPEFFKDWPISQVAHTLHKTSRLVTPWGHMPWVRRFVAGLGRGWAAEWMLGFAAQQSVLWAKNPTPQTAARQDATCSRGLADIP